MFDSFISSLMVVNLEFLFKYVYKQLKTFIEKYNSKSSYFNQLLLNLIFFITDSLIYLSFISY